MAAAVSLVVAVATARLWGGGGGGAAASAGAAGAGSSNNHSCMKCCATPSDRDGGAFCLRQLFHGQGLFRPFGVVLLVLEGPEHAWLLNIPYIIIKSGPFYPQIFFSDLAYSDSEILRLSVTSLPVRAGHPTSLSFRRRQWQQVGWDCGKDWGSDEV